VLRPEERRPRKPHERNVAYAEIGQTRRLLESARRPRPGVPSGAESTTKTDADIHRYQGEKALRAVFGSGYARLGRIEFGRANSVARSMLFCVLR
jgi:hypothetical protein